MLDPSFLLITAHRISLVLFLLPFLVKTWCNLVACSLWERIVAGSSPVVLITHFLTIFYLYLLWLVLWLVLVLLFEVNFFFWLTIWKVGPRVDIPSPLTNWNKSFLAVGNSPVTSLRFISFTKNIRDWEPVTPNESARLIWLGRGIFDGQLNVKCKLKATFER